MPVFAKVADYHRGWLIGNFDPSLLREKSFEICLASHSVDEIAQAHYHTDSTEINVVLDGQLKVGKRLLEEGDIFIYERLEVSDVTFLSDVRLLVIRLPSQPHDKVIV